MSTNTELNPQTFIEFVVDQLFEGIGPEEGKIPFLEFKEYFESDKAAVVSTLTALVFTEQFMSEVVLHFGEAIKFTCHHPQKIFFSQREKLGATELTKTLTSSITKRFNAGA